MMTIKPEDQCVYIRMLVTAHCARGVKTFTGMTNPTLHLPVNKPIACLISFI